MPRYYFHRINGGFDPDIEGTELADLDTARVEAIQFAAGTVRDRPNYVWDGKIFRIEVTNESGMLVCTVVVLGIDSVAARAK